MIMLSFCLSCCGCFFFCFSSRRRHTRCALVTGVQTCALPIYERLRLTLIGYSTRRSLLACANRAALPHQNACPTNDPLTCVRQTYQRSGMEIGRASCRERVCQYV